MGPYDCIQLSGRGQSGMGGLPAARRTAPARLTDTGRATVSTRGGVARGRSTRTRRVDWKR